MIPKFKERMIDEHKQTVGFKATYIYEAGDSKIEFDDNQKKICIVSDSKATYINYADLVSVDLLYSPDTYTEPGWAGCIAGSLIGGMGMSIAGGIASSKDYDAIRMSIKVQTNYGVFYAPVFSSPVVINEFVEEMIRDAVEAVAKIQEIIGETVTSKINETEEATLSISRALSETQPNEINLVEANNETATDASNTSATKVDTAKSNLAVDSSASSKNKRKKAVGSQKDAIKLAKSLDNEELISYIIDIKDEMSYNYKIATSTNSREGARAYSDFAEQGVYLAECIDMLINKLPETFINDGELDKYKHKSYSLIGDRYKSYDENNMQLISDLKEGIKSARELYSKIYAANYSGDIDDYVDNYMFEISIMIDKTTELLYRIKVWTDITYGKVKVEQSFDDDDEEDDEYYESYDDEE